ncbi:hypothetical protein RJ639_011842, partial [Escallonia herrerae]
MASSSRQSCFQCEDASSAEFRNGWRLRSGEFAQLCQRCASVFEEGRFCETFHSNDDGWRDCESCGKARNRCLSLESQTANGEPQGDVVIEPHGFPIKVQDTEGKEWEFHFRYWPNCGSKMYVLEGLRDYMISMNWQPGDIVTFYRMEPEGKLIMGLRKTSVGAPPHE